MLQGGAPHAVVKNEPLTYLEQKRKEAQQEYLAEQAYLRKNEGEIKKMIEDEMKVSSIFSYNDRASSWLITRSCYYRNATVWRRRQEDRSLRSSALSSTALRIHRRSRRQQRQGQRQLVRLPVRRKCSRVRRRAGSSRRADGLWRRKQGILYISPNRHETS